MKQFLIRSRRMVLALLLMAFNCAFASVESPVFLASSNSTAMQPYQVGAAPAIKKLPHLKRPFRVLKYKANKAGSGSKVLVVILAASLALLLAFGIYIVAFGGGSATLLTLIGLIGLALILFGAARIIRRINRKRGRVGFRPDTNKRAAV